MADEAKEDIGLAGVMPEGHVPVVGRYGNLLHVREADWPRLKAEGYRFQTPEEQDKYNARLRYGGTLGEAKAFGLGALRGATLGGSDVALKAAGLMKDYQLRGYEEENPNLSGAGELATAIGSEFIPVVGQATAPRLAAKVGKLGAKALGLAEEVGHGAKLAEEAAKGLSTGKKLLGKTVSGAIEGSIFGLGSSVSEAALGDPGLNAQKVIANVGLGSILGAAGGGLGGLFDEAAGPALERTAKSLEDVEGGLTGLSRRQANKAMGFIQGDLNRSLRDPKQQAEMAEMLMARGHVKGTAAENLASVQKDLAETGKALGRELGIPELEAGKIHGGLLGGEKSEAEAALKTALESHWEREAAVMKAADASQLKPYMPEVAEKLQQFYSGLNPSARRLAKPHLEGALEDLETAAREGLGFQKVNEIKTTLARSAWAGGDSETTALKKAIASTIKDSIDSQLEPVVGGELAREFKDAKRVYGILKAGEDAIGSAKSRGVDAINAMVERAGLQSETARAFKLLSIAEDAGIRGANRASGNKFFGLTDQLKGLVGGSIGAGIGGPVGAIAGNIAGQFASRTLEARGPAMVAHMADWITKTPAAMAIANHLGHSLGKVVGNLGEFGPHLVAAFASSPAKGLAEHVLLSRESPEYRERLEASGFGTPDNRETMAALDKVRSIESARLAIEEQDKKTDRQVNHIIRGADVKPSNTQKTQDFGAKRQNPKDSLTAHQKHVEDVMKLAANPAGLVDRVAKNTADITEHTPALASALAASSQRAVQFLQQKAAKPPPGGPLAKAWKPSADEVAAFSRSLEAVQKPQSVLRHAAAGTLTAEHVEALRTVYPQLYQHMVSRVVERLTDGPKVPYRARVMLSLLIGQDVDGTLSPAAVNRNQLALKAPSQKQDAAPTGKAEKLTVAQRLQTNQQGIDARKGA